MDDKIEFLAFSVDQAAARTGLGRDKIYEAIRNGELAAHKAGRRTLLTSDALRAFLNSLPKLQLPAA